VQLNSVRRTGAYGFTRLANQALFDGPVLGGQDFYIVDDFIGQGGTLATSAGLIREHGRAVLGSDGIDRKALV
jgi:adenine/guanine phosphoribosyltransferase-like PRPP-binding protein